jgi:hypothetical protein
LPQTAREPKKFCSAPRPIATDQPETPLAISDWEFGLVLRRRISVSETQNQSKKFFIDGENTNGQAERRRCKIKQVFKNASPKKNRRVGNPSSVFQLAVQSGWLTLLLGSLQTIVTLLRNGVPAPLPRPEPEPRNPAT